MPTKIEWTDETWNPTTGCSKVSHECKNCYALRDWGRLKHNPRSVYFGREFTDVMVHPERLEVPLRWSRPRRIFVDSMSDLFHERIPDAFILEVLGVARQATQHVFQILTKRAERMCRFVEAHNIEPAANIQLGVSAGDQLGWDERVPWLLRTPAATRFVSCEPLLGLIDGRGRLEGQRSSVSVPPIADWQITALDWLIAGGESGPDARPSHAKWVRWLRDQCSTGGVAFFFKQWGEWLPEGQQRIGLVVPEVPRHHDFGDGSFARRVGKAAAGRMLDGLTHEGQR